MEAPGEDQLVDEGSRPYLLFTLSGATFAIAAHDIEQVAEPRGITPLPNVPSWLAGVTQLNGRIVSCIDLADRLRLGERAVPSAPRAVVVRSKDGTIVAALLVDTILSLRNATLDPSATNASFSPTLFRGSLVGIGDVVSVVDTERVLDARDTGLTNDESPA